MKQFHNAPRKTIIMTIVARRMFDGCQALVFRRRPVIASPKTLPIPENITFVPRF